MDYISDLKYRGLISRIKRISDAAIADGRRLYKHLDIGIEPNWYLIFSIINEKGQTSISEISSILKFSHPSVIAIVKKMDASGYLNISSSDLDKRKQVIELSSKAKEQMPEMKVVWDACEEAVSSIFENDQFIIELDKMEKAFKESNFFDRVIKNLGTEEVIIQDFTEKDAESFAELNYEWLEKYFIVETIDRQVLNYPLEEIINKGGQIRMAKMGLQNVGTYALLSNNKDEIELCKMAVQPNSRKIGIGMKMLDDAIERAKEQNYSNLILYSNTQLKSAIRLYKKKGFKKVPLEKNSLYDRANIKMSLSL